MPGSDDFWEMPSISKRAIIKNHPFDLFTWSMFPHPAQTSSPQPMEGLVSIPRLSPGGFCYHRTNKMLQRFWRISRQHDSWCAEVCVFVWQPQGHEEYCGGGCFCQVLMALNECHWMLWVSNCSPESPQHWQVQPWCALSSPAWVSRMLITLAVCPEVYFACCVPPPQNLSILSLQV